MSNHKRSKPHDLLPTYEPFLPICKEDALLVFGKDAGATEELPNWYGPTDAAPGSLEKVRVLRQRAEYGLPLWHPGDKVDASGCIGIILFDQREVTDED